MGGHFTGALAYADNITLLSPSMSGLRTLSKICEEYAIEFDVTFNGKKSQLLFFRGRECVFSNLNIYVCGQLVDMYDSATHLGHFIASTDKKSIVKSAKSCFWRSFNICMSDFGQLSYIVKCKLFYQYCCSFYGSPLWFLKSTIVEFMCNPMSCSGDNYRELLDGQGILHLEPCLLSWKYNLTNLRNYMYTLKELIDIRDGIKECNGFTKAEISRFILNICTR